MRSVLAASLLDPEELLRKGGLALLALIVFAESGLLVGFFLPGDSLLFIAGFLSSDAGGNVLPPLPLVLLVTFVAAVAGDQVGYLFGRKVGPALFDKPDSRIFKQRYVEKAHTFFERHGAKTIVLARFVPIVRTFAPIVAGVGEMRYRTFVTFNVVGGFLWAVGVTTLGYYLGEIDVVKDNIEIAIVVIVTVSVLPMAIEMLRHWRAARRGLDASDEVDVPPVPADVPADAPVPD
jgi:membrane-associated protein